MIVYSVKNEVTEETQIWADFNAFIQSLIHDIANSTPKPGDLITFPVTITVKEMTREAFVSHPDHAIWELKKGLGAHKPIIILPVIHCARCGENHEALAYVKFDRPIQDEDGTAWWYWATCPTTNDPVLMRSANDEYTPQALRDDPAGEGNQE
jgi:hypothetical protein